MNMDDLLEYLRIVVNVEEIIYIRNSLIESLRYQINQLQFQKKPIKPIPPKKPDKPVIETIPNTRMVRIIAGVICLIAFWIFPKIMDTIYPHTSQVPGGFFVIFWGLPVAGIILLIAGFSTNDGDQAKKRNIEKTDRYQKELDHYKDSKAKYDRELSAYNHDLNRVNLTNQESLRKKDYLNEQIRALEQANNESLRTLDKLYNQGIIYYNYRNLTAISAIIEYLESGRCLTLEEAYNKFDMEIKTDAIISLLGNITNNQERMIGVLNRINNSITNVGRNLYQLTKSIDHIDSTVSNMNSSIKQSLNSIANNQNMINSNLNKSNAHLKKIRINTNISAFNSECTKRELNYLRRMDDLEKGRWLNP